MNNPDKKDVFEMGVHEMDKFLKRYELKRLHEDFFQKITLLVIASVGFIAAIAWDQALKLIFTQFFGGLETVGEKLLYAVIITIIAVIVSLILGKIFLKKGEK